MRFFVTALISVLLPVLALGASAENAPKDKPVTPADLLASSTPADWRTPELNNLLYFEFGNGPVIIELAPDYAPRHVERVRSLAREKYWDGLEIARVQDGYVVQWMDPKAGKSDRKKFKGSEEVLPPELDVELEGLKAPFHPLSDKDTYAAQTGFTDGMAAGRDPKSKRTWLLHCYGAVGVGRDVAPESGDGTELYAVIGHAPRHLDRNVTVIGRVLHGMELLSSLPRGHGPMGFYDSDKGDKGIRIRSIRLGADVPEKDRLKIEVLRTDTPLFQRYVEARRSRKDEWFHFQAGRIEACNVPIPVRVR